MKVQRIKRMYDYILANQTVTIDTLCEVFEVSRNTVRRDLDELIKQGNISKIYGGVTINTARDTVPFEERTIKNMDLKERIAKKATELVCPGDTLFIDSGTTATCFYAQILQMSSITLFTNNIEVLMRSLTENDFRVIFTGGRLARKTYSVVGHDAAYLLSHYNIGKAFLSATAISLERGVANSSEGEYQVKKAVVENCSDIYLMIDSSKFDKISLMTYAKIHQIHTIITDKLPPQRYMDYCGENGIRLMLAD